MVKAALAFLANVTGLALLWSKLKNTKPEQARAISAQDQAERARITADVQSKDAKKVANDIAT